MKLDLEKRPAGKDTRLESYSPASEIKVQEHIHTSNNGWEQRMEIIDKLPMERNMNELIVHAKQIQNPSMAFLKPIKILDFIIEKEDSREWTQQQLSYFNQPDLFKDVSMTKLQKLPYKYSYKFITEDEKERTLMIEDWESGCALLELFKHL